MTRRRQLRVAICVEPTILGDALACVLHEAGVDEVVNLGPGPPPAAPAAPDSAFDAAVVTIVLPAAVDADVVIELPPTPTGTGAATVTVHGHRHPVEIHDLADVLRLLEGPEPYDAG